MPMMQVASYQFAAPSRMYVVTPTNSTTGRMTNAKSLKPSPKCDAWATRASATIAPDRAERNIPARLNDSFQASDRVASRPQCSVDRIWSRIAGVIPSDPAAGGPVVPAGGGAGSAGGGTERSNDIWLLATLRFRPVGRHDDDTSTTDRRPRQGGV